MRAVRVDIYSDGLTETERTLHEDGTVTRRTRTRPFLGAAFGPWTMGEER